MAAVTPEQTAERVRRAGLPAHPFQLDLVLVVAPAPQFKRGLARQRLRLVAREVGPGPRLRRRQSLALVHPLRCLSSPEMRRITGDAAADSTAIGRAGGASSVAASFVAGSVGSFMQALGATPALREQVVRSVRSRRHAGA